jgi:hypothetical protein
MLLFSVIEEKLIFFNFFVVPAGEKMKGKCSRWGLYLFSPVEIFEKMPKINLFDFSTPLSQPFFPFFFCLEVFLWEI